MKYKFLFGALCVTTAFFTSCVEEEITNHLPRYKGDDIVFGARAGFENGTPEATRTTYRGNSYNPGDGKVYESIDWVPGTDRVLINCPEASAPADDPTVNYLVKTEASGGNDAHSYATMERSETEDVGLQWGDDVAHTFYALYPSPEMIPASADTSIHHNVFLKDKVVTGYIPHTQRGLIPDEKEAGVYVIKPDMTYAYMVAKEAVAAGVGGEGVNLTFFPIVTALEVTMTLPGKPNKKLELTEIRLTSDEHPLSGSFTCDLSGWDGASVPACGYGAQGLMNVVNVPLWRNTSSDSSNPDYEPLQLKGGEAIRFTVFLHPAADITHLHIGIHTADGITRKHLFKANDDGDNDPSNDFKITKQTKTVISGLTLPDELNFELASWMAYLEDTRKLGQLSIPGTGASFSYNYTASDAKYFQAQTLDLDEQWNAGIRAFEIISDRPVSISYSSTNHLGHQYAKCNSKGLGITLNDAFKELITKVQSTSTITNPNGTEFAFVMLTYQPEGANPPRSAEEYTKALAAFYNNELSKYNTSTFKRFEAYTPDLTVEDARGKIFIAARASQHVEDDDAGHNWDGHLVDASSNALPIMLIKGAGTAKDKWGCRGYKVDRGDGVFVDALDIQPSGNDYEKDANGDYVNPVVENYMCVTAENQSDVNAVEFPNWNQYVKKPAADGTSADFEYETNIIKDAGASDNKDKYYHVWFQEWQRVVPRDMKLSLGRCGSISPHYFYVYWHESYTEKATQVKLAFDKAIGDGSHDRKYVYINSLCGYYVDPDNRNSYIPYADDPCTVSSHGWFGGLDWPVGGLQGDIQGLARDLNNMLYNYMIEKGYDNGTGPIGIVYMNCVKNNEADGKDLGSYYLPGVIVANNFK